MQSSHVEGFAFMLLLHNSHDDFEARAYFTETARWFNAGPSSGGVFFQPSDGHVKTGHFHQL